MIFFLCDVRGRCCVYVTITNTTVQLEHRLVTAVARTDEADEAKL
jgi:hypothetical protein